MVGVNISLTKEAYDFLIVLKGRNKSFSDVILDFKNGVRRKGELERIY
jgi:predicted CopG family antitoxin